MSLTSCMSMKFQMHLNMTNAQLLMLIIIFNVVVVLDVKNNNTYIVFLSNSITIKTCAMHTV